MQPRRDMHEFHPNLPLGFGVHITPLPPFPAVDVVCTTEIEVYPQPTFLQTYHAIRGVRLCSWLLECVAAQTSVFEQTVSSGCERKIMESGGFSTSADRIPGKSSNPLVAGILQVLDFRNWDSLLLQSRMTVIKDFGPCRIFFSTVHVAVSVFSRPKQIVCATGADPLRRWFDASFVYSSVELVKSFSNVAAQSLLQKNAQCSIKCKESSAPVKYCRVSGPARAIYHEVVAVFCVNAGLVSLVVPQLPQFAHPPAITSHPQSTQSTVQEATN